VDTVHFFCFVFLACFSFSHGDQLWLCGLIPHSALVGVRDVKKMQDSKVVIAISHPDQSGFWE
jgi:hypothetical protein